MTISGIPLEKTEETLAQTQCTACGFKSCQAYAQALEEDKAPINLCQPGGVRVIKALAVLLDKQVEPPAKPALAPQIIRIDDSCIGCTLCINLCPTGAIVGSPRVLHTVKEKDCTGCGLCVEPCPENSIVLKEGGEADSAPRAAYIRRLVQAKQKRNQAKSHRKQAVGAVRKNVKQEAQTPLTQAQQARIDAARAKASQKWSAKPTGTPKVLREK